MIFGRYFDNELLTFNYGVFEGKDLKFMQNCYKFFKLITGGRDFKKWGVV